MWEMESLTATLTAGYGLYVYTSALCIRRVSEMVKKKWKQVEMVRGKNVTVIPFCTKESMKSGRIGLISRILGAAH